MTDNFPLFLQQILLPALKDTLYMVVTSTILASIIGFVLAIILFVTDKDGLRPRQQGNTCTPIQTQRRHHRFDELSYTSQI